MGSRRGRIYTFNKVWGQNKVLHNVIARLRPIELRLTGSFRDKVHFAT